MQIGEKWLRSWIDPPVSHDTLSEQLTNLGLEVAELNEIKPQFTGVVVGEISDVQSHPTADRLSVCRVSAGTEDHQVVCGAPNVYAGMKVPYARIGAILPGGTAIREMEIRGQLSEGMLCSPKELGLSDDHSGILDLESSIAVGTDLAQLFELTDRTFVFDLTPNRGDCFSLRGIARELAVVNEMDFVEPKQSHVPSTCDTRVDIELKDPAGCPLYLGRVVRDVDLSKPTPTLIVKRLENSGLRAINPVVDVLNFVMLELGQPMHAFDLDHVSDGIVVRRARAGEKLILLDGEEITFDEQVLLITSGDRPVAIAGVIGGLVSGVTENTTRVLLECAYFPPSAIFGTARNFGMHTDASTRYERGVDYQLQHRAIERATELLLDAVGGEAGPVVEASDTNYIPIPDSFAISQEKLTQAIGESLPETTVTGIFERLGLQPTRTSDGWRVTQPSHRYDIEIEEDLVEEVCRVYGYDNIATCIPHTDLELRQAKSKRGDASDLRSRLASLGYYEVISYSFVDQDDNARFAPAQSYPVLQNPISSDRGVMRGSLLPGLLSMLDHNIARQADSIRIFEHGQCFNETSEGLEQEYFVGGIASGNRHPESWSHGAELLDFYDVKGDLEQLLPQQSIRFDRSKRDFLHPGQSAEIFVNDVHAGFIGRLHPELESRTASATPVFVFQCRSSALETVDVPQYTHVSAFPSINRDLALIVDASLESSHIETIVRDVVGDLLVKFTIFDVYQGEGIDENKKSIGIGLKLQDRNKTLQVEEANSQLDRVIDALSSKLGAQLRDF